MKHMAIITLATLIFAVCIAAFLHSDESKSGPRENHHSQPGHSKRGPNDLDPIHLEALEASQVEIAFLGKIPTRKTITHFSFKSTEGSAKELPLTIHYTNGGRFIRAEYQSPAPKEPIFGVGDIEMWSKSRHEKVVGLPSAPMKISLRELFDTVWSTDALGDADRIEVTYEMFEDSSFTAKPVITVRLIGVKMPISTGHAGAIERVRYVFDENGELLFLDNAA